MKMVYIGKKINDPSKLKLWTFFWGQGEREKLLVNLLKAF